MQRPSRKPMTQRTNGGWRDCWRLSDPSKDIRCMNSTVLYKPPMAQTPKAPRHWNQEQRRGQCLLEGIPPKIFQLQLCPYVSTLESILQQHFWASPVNSNKKSRRSYINSKITRHLDRQYPCWNSKTQQWRASQNFAVSLFISEEVDMSRDLRNAIINVIVYGCLPLGKSLLGSSSQWPKKISPHPHPSRGTVSFIFTTQVA